jgi:hypothetical protein
MHVSINDLRARSGTNSAVGLWSVSLLPINDLPFKHDALAHGNYELPVTW